MVTISNFKVTSYSKEEMLPLWDSKEVPYPNFVRVDFYLDGEFEDASGKSDYVRSKVIWCSSSFAAHKVILSSIINEVL